MDGFPVLTVLRGPGSQKAAMRFIQHLIVTGGRRRPETPHGWQIGSLKPLLEESFSGLPGFQGQRLVALGNA